MHEPNEFGVPTHAHSHTEAHSHSHPHVHESKKNVVNRLARAIGHLEKVKRMVEDDCDCAEVLIQIAAVRAAIENTGKVILQDHIQHCIVDAVKSGDTKELDELNKAIEQFIK